MSDTTNTTTNENKITPIYVDKEKQTVSSLKNRPNAATAYGGNGLTAAELKERFDALATLAINKINEIIGFIYDDRATFSAELKIGGDSPFTTLQALGTAIKGGTLADEIVVDKVDEVGYGDGDETTGEEFSTLQNVLTYLTHYISALETAKSGGTLADEIVVDKVDPVGGDNSLTILQGVLDYLTNYVSNLEKRMVDGSLAKNIAIPAIGDENEISTLDGLANSISGGACPYLSDYLLIPGERTNHEKEQSISWLIHDLLDFKKKHPAVVYTPMGSIQSLPDLESPDFADWKPGYVISVDPKDGKPFEYNGNTYPPGTNFVLIKNESGKKWDPLGGIISFEGAAKEIKVPEYSGKDTLEGVLDKVTTPWDLIITDPDDLATKLATATGNVLVKLKDEYAGRLEVTLNSGLKLIDFSGSVFGLDCETLVLIAGENSNTIVKNIRAYGRTYCSLKGFDLVENCRGVFRYKLCKSIENSDIFQAEDCEHIRDCEARHDTWLFGHTMFQRCSYINNVSFYPPNLDWDGEPNPWGFEDCKYISNVRYAADIEDKVYYRNCTFVDPYTCAGYVSPDNSGKVPVPDDKGDVVFKTVVPVVRNTERHNALYVQVNEANGGGQLLNLFGKSAYGGYIVQRTENGQLTAPDQLMPKYKPQLDEYISRRYLENTVGDIEEALRILNEGSVTE